MLYGALFAFALLYLDHVQHGHLDAGLADVSNVGRGRSRSGSKKLHANSKNCNIVRISVVQFVPHVIYFFTTFRALTGLFFPKAKAFSAIQSSSLSVFDLIRTWFQFAIIPCAFILSFSLTRHNEKRAGAHRNSAFSGIAGGKSPCRVKIAFCRSKIDTCRN